jgi:predicted dehydrogenase
MADKLRRGRALACPRVLGTWQDPGMSNITPTIGVGMLGYAFMGKAHANAYRTLSYMTWPPPLQPELVMIAGRNREAVDEAAFRYGFIEAVTDWDRIAEDERVGLFDNCGPNGLHAEPTLAAARAGKHVLCEKPLGRDAEESFAVWQGVAATGVVHMCAFNYRFVPAVRLARELIAAGELGEIRHFRARYLQSWGTEESLMTWRFDRQQAGSGALGDLGAHIVDLARYLVGEITTVSGTVRTFIGDRAGHAVDVDDAFTALIEFQGGALGTLEASRLCIGRLNHLVFEVNGSRASLAFDLERLNELRVSTTGGATTGFQTVNVTDPNHPFMEYWWPPGHIIGWEHTFVHEIHHLLSAIQADGKIGPHGADFEDGYRAAEVCDAVIRSSRSGTREHIPYRG